MRKILCFLALLLGFASHDAMADNIARSYGDMYGRYPIVRNPTGDMFVDRHLGTGRPWVPSDRNDTKALRDVPPPYLPQRYDMFQSLQPPPYLGFHPIFHPRRDIPSTPPYPLYHYDAR